MIITQEEYLEHYGVQGMKWGQRKAAKKAAIASLRGKGLSARQAKSTYRYQTNVDRQKMTAMGRQGKVSALKQLQNRAVSNRMLSLKTIAKHPFSSQKAATLQLQKNKETQARIAAGQKKATQILLKVQGISLKDIDFDT